MDQTLIAGRYEIRDLLGRGAGRTVVAAMDRQRGRMVAIRLIRRPGPDAPAATAALNSALRDAQAAGRLGHPGIVTVHDVGICPEYAWIARESVNGETMQAVLDRQGPPPLVDAARLMDELLAALGAAHGHGLVHRDLSPATILLAERPGPGWGRVRLTDFGSGRLGEALASPASATPEHLRGEPLDHRADIWAAGLVLYQLLTGARPFQGAPITIIQAVLDGEALPPSARVPGLPPALDGIIARALAKRPADRFPDAAGMAEAIGVAVMPAAVPQARRTHPQGLIGFLRRKRA